MIDEVISKMSSEPGFEGCQVKVIEPPRSTLHTIKTCRKLCHQNRCGSYGRSWGCPPALGKDDENLEYINHFRHAVLISHRFENVDMKDLEFIEKSAEQHQDLCRRVANAIRKKGISDVLPVCSGACKYCGECTYPDAPCKFPEQMVPSVSGFGIIMEDYLQSQNISFKFEDNAFTLYGLVLYRE